MSSVGIGYDSHRFAAGRRLVLGGVEIAHERGLEGHSDADVLVHAVIDALLGAAGLGDIGLHLPHRSDARRSRAASLVSAPRRASCVREGGGRTVVHADATVLAEPPKVSPH